MLDRKNLFELAKVVANANPSSQVSYSFGEDKFSYSQLNDTLRTELNELAGNYQLYRENKNLLFSLIEDTIERYNKEILPAVILIPSSQGTLGIGMKKISDYVEKAIGSNIF